MYDLLMENVLGNSRSPIQIGEVARRVKLSIDAIRFYERTALIPRASRTMGQFRLYTVDDVARLAFIKKMQGLGFSLREIKQLLGLRNRGGHACRDVRDLLSSKLTEIRGKIRNLQNLECELVFDLQKCNRELKDNRGHGAQCCPILRDGNERMQ